MVNPFRSPRTEEYPVTRLVRHSLVPHFLGPQAVLICCLLFGVWLSVTDFLSHLSTWLSFGKPETGFVAPLAGILKSSQELWLRRLLLGAAVGVVLAGICFGCRRRIRFIGFVTVSFAIPLLIFLAINIADYGSGTAVDPGYRTLDMWMYSCVSAITMLIAGLLSLRSTVLDSSEPTNDPDKSSAQL